MAVCRPDPLRELGEMIGGYRISQLLFVAAELQIADCLEEGARSSSEIAHAVHKRKKLKVDRQSLYRVMRALANSGVFREVREDCFKNSSLSIHLITGAPGSLRDTALMVGLLYYKAWGGVLRNVRNGKNAFEQVYKDRFFPYLDKHPALSKVFDATMTQRALKRNKAISDACVKAGLFRGVTGIVDVGGGCGRLLVSLLNSHPEVPGGLLFDRKDVIANARRFLRKDAVAKEVRKGQEVELKEGDFFRAVPCFGKGASYVLAEVLHDWEDARSSRILRNCHTAMSPASQLVVVEQIVPGPRTRDRSKLTDVHMMVLTGGRERNKAEFTKILSAAGFCKPRIIPTESWVKLIVSTRK